MPVSLELLKAIPHPDRLFKATIITTSYDPDFKPTDGYLTGKYNGALIRIFISGISTKTHICQPYSCINIERELLAPGVYTWKEIWEHTLEAVIMSLYQHTAEIKKELVAQGVYCEH